MKFTKFLLGIFLTVLLIPNIVMAKENTVTLKAPTTASKDEEIAVEITLESEVAIDEFKSSLTYETSVLEILNIENKNDWNQEQPFSKESPLSLTFTHENGLSGKTTVATIKFKVKKDVAKKETSISIEGTTKTKEDGTIDTLEKATAKIDIKSRDNTLSDLKVNGETVTNFSPTNCDYSFEVLPSVTTANFEATLNDNTATFKDNYGPKKGASLDYGENTFEIIVVSATKEERKYVVKITRQDNRGTDSHLSKLEVRSDNSDKELIEDFNQNTLRYTITTHRLEDIYVAPTTKDPNATFKVEKPEKLVIGINEIKITVTSEKKDKETVYTVVVNNLDSDIDTTLKDIELFNCDEDINFEIDKYDYEIMYKEKYRETLVIKPIVNNEDEAVCSIDKDISNLTPGSKVTITVKAKDGTKNVERYYTITFKKDNRINFFLILSLIIFIVLLVIFIRLIMKNKKIKQVIKTKEKELEKTKRLEKINLE